MKRRNIKSVNRKGNVFDIILLSVMLFVLIIGGVAVTYCSDLITGALLNDSQISQNVGANATLTAVNVGMSGWIDNAVLFFLIMMFIGVIASAFLIDTHPFFFVVALILLLFVFGFVWVVMDEAGHSLLTGSDFGSTFNNMTKTKWVMDNFVLIMFAMSFLVFVVLYTKGRMNTFGGGGL